MGSAEGRWRALIAPFFVVSIAYFFSFVVVDALPHQFFWGDHERELGSASLVFLPHGIRVLTAWLYGWKSIILLAPSAYAVHILRLTEQSVGFLEILAPIFGIVCAATVFVVLERLGLSVLPRAGRLPRWRNVVVAGSAASVINSIGTNLIYQNEFKVMLAYWIGDTLGMLALLLGMMLFFRYVRRNYGDSMS